MKNAKYLMAALVALAGLTLSSVSKADISPITTVNDTDYGMWITIYDPFDSGHADYGCVPPRQTKTWSSGNYISIMAPYTVRAEMMSTPDCRGKKLDDLSVGASPNRTYMVSLISGGFTWSRVLGSPAQTPNEN
ncbi:hypothetical protein [uncultured Bdellovibrio sp.]|uniref:hypothetical protein n=1 Tax=Bdellovibrio sp. HCB-162 TaxID=3394234 RepID=UPI0025CBE691|nr:hypothetical protein [uncultured Bdellovibrio sp.]